jgi:hypothetical protein
VPKSLGEDLDEIAIATQIEDLQPNCPRFTSKTDSPLIKEKINLGFKWVSGDRKPWPGKSILPTLGADSAFPA